MGSITVRDGVVTRRNDPDPDLTPYVYNDGGRFAAGYKGHASDCVARALAIVLERPYADVYGEINDHAKEERRRDGRQSSAREGVYKETTRRVMRAFGLVWVPTMAIGSGCTVHLRRDELPPGRLIASVSKHVVAVIDGVVYDTHDPGRNGTRCVYGYWRMP